MVPFWGVLGAAALLLVIYLALPKKAVPGGGRPGLGRETTLRSPDQRKDLPDFRVKLYNGERAVSRGDLKGKVAVLHLWATWCPPCRSEFPDFARYAKEVGPGVEVVAISLDADPSVIGGFDGGVKGMPPIYIDPQGTLAAELGTTGIPETLLIDSKGRIAFRASGAQDWGKGGVPRLVEQLQKEAG